MGIELTFGLNVRKFRVSRGWSQEDLADASDLDRTYISGVERGTRNPTLRVVEQIASALGVKVTELLGQG